MKITFSTNTLTATPKHLSHFKHIQYNSVLSTVTTDLIPLVLFY